MRTHLVRVLAALLVLAVATPATAQKKLTIIHLNDTHSHLEPERTGDDAGRGGVIERAAYRDSVIRAEGRRNVLMLHAGDFNQGTSYFSVLGGDLEADLVNALGYDCITLGNHEFDNGIEDLTRRVKRIKCPVVVANYDFSPFELGRYVKPYAIVRKAGLKIGIIGLLPDISSLVAGETARKLQAFDRTEVVNKWAAYLKEKKHCDIVIALTHIGYGDDKHLAAETRNVDLIVGGHSHTFLKKPYLGTNLDGWTVPVVQNGCWGLNVGNLKISVDR
ncbi:MAG: metallophosphoesterase [Bacteroidales bacterium]|nr:metallophosphoesterase [Bacteroidales bacterium]